MKTAKLFSAAQAHHQAGRLDQARDLYCRVLEADPDHPVAWQRLGVIARLAGNLDLACRCLERATTLAPCDPLGHFHLGTVHLMARRGAQAKACFHEALRLKPGYADAENNLGVALMREGQWREAEGCFDRLLGADPARANTHANMAEVCVSLGQHEEAERSAREALRLEPNHPEAMNLLGVALAARGRRPEAIATFRQLVAVAPRFAEAFLNLGKLSLEMGYQKEAVQFVEQAIRLRAGHAASYTVLGLALASLERLDESLAAHREALRLSPDNPATLNAMGATYRRMSRPADAMSCYQQALHIAPDFASAHASLGSLYISLGRVRDAEAALRKSLSLKPDAPKIHSNLLFCLTNSPAIDPKTLFEEHCKWEALHAARGPFPPHRNDPDPDRRLRVGYVSGDLYRHAVAKYIEPILASHDRNRVEVFCYNQGSKCDEVTDWLRQLAHRWRHTPDLTDEELVELIRSDEIDVLVDLSGHTGGNRLGAFSYRPAPVQVTYLGYMNTTGLTSIDYLLTDDTLHPPGAPAYATEELFRVPGGVYAFVRTQDAPEVGPLPALATGRLTFGSLHNLLKINERVLDVWAEVLHAAPGSRLLMFRDTLHGEARGRLARAFASRGIDAERLDLREGHSRPGYLGVYNEIDLSLDTFPYGAGTTTNESLWMGVPTITLRGETMVSRSSAMLLTRVGLPEFIADSPAAYVAVARRWASDLPGLARVRSGLRGAMSATICDGAGVTRGLEDAYREMWRRWCARRAAPQEVTHA